MPVPPDPRPWKCLISMYVIRSTVSAVAVTCRPVFGWEPSFGGLLTYLRFTRREVADDSVD